MLSTPTPIGPWGTVMYKGEPLRNISTNTDSPLMPPIDAARRFSVEQEKLDVYTPSILEDVVD